MEFTKELYDALNGGQQQQGTDVNQQFSPGNMNKVETDIVEGKINQATSFAKVLAGLGMGDPEADSYVRDKYLSKFSKLSEKMAHKALATGKIDKFLDRKMQKMINDPEMYKDIQKLKEAAAERNMYKQLYEKQEGWRQGMFHDPTKDRFLQKDEFGHYMNNPQVNYKDMINDIQAHQFSMEPGAKEGYEDFMKDMMMHRDKHNNDATQAGSIYDERFKTLNPDQIRDMDAQILWHATHTTDPQLYKDWAAHHTTAEEEKKIQDILDKQKAKLRADYVKRMTNPDPPATPAASNYRNSTHDTVDIFQHLVQPQVPSVGEDMRAEDKRLAKKTGETQWHTHKHTLQYYQELGTDVINVGSDKNPFWVFDISDKNISKRYNLDIDRDLWKTGHKYTWKDKKGEHTAQVYNFHGHTVRVDHFNQFIADVQSALSNPVGHRSGVAPSGEEILQAYVDIDTKKIKRIMEKYPWIVKVYGNNCTKMLSEVFHINNQITSKHKNLEKIHNKWLVSVTPKFNVEHTVLGTFRYIKDSFLSEAQQRVLWLNEHNKLSGPQLRDFNKLPDATKAKMLKEYKRIQHLK